MTQKKKYVFRFEHMWMMKKGCSDTIEAVWAEQVTDPWDTRVVKKIDRCGIALTRWSKQTFGSVKRELQQKRKALQQVERDSLRTGDSRNMRFLEAEINKLLDKEAKMWAQRAKILWLKDGDRNTRFFHTRTSQRRCRNYITKLYDPTGRWCTRQSEVNEIIVNFYKDLFTTANPDGMEEVLETIPHAVTDDMNDMLLSDFTIEEVEKAV